MLHIQISTQTLTLLDCNHQLISHYPISSALKGVGEKKGSEQTPRGAHVIRAKIGAGLPIYSVFRARRPTGEIYHLQLQSLFPNRDWILTRILWLSGLEKDVNRLGDVDTMQRFIYIHGTADEEQIGTPNSHGCIRMRNCDIIKLFDQISVGERVYIEL